MNAIREKAFKDQLQFELLSVSPLVIDSVLQQLD